MGKDIVSGDFSGTVSGKENAINYLKSFIDESIAWYDERRKGKKFWSKGLRFGTIIFMSGGTLVSLLPTTLVQDVHKLLVERSAPGILVALAGLCLTLDKAYGHTSGWKRYMETSGKLQAKKDEFHFFRCQVEPQLSEQQVISECKRIMLEVREIIAKEVAEWANELSYQQQITAVGKKDDEGKGKAA